ncbi:MAG TPA: hypothetical protein VMZ04_04870 [Anaerolineae bacterium]|nr:hypothetical protein [Anaerolineae bacterium]
MATTSQLLTWIELQNQGWTREGSKGTRALLNEAHKLLLYNEIEQRVVIDNSTGDFPYLETQDEIYQYDLPANCSILKSVLVDYDETRDAYPWSYDDFNVKGRRYYRILNITSREATFASNGRLTFIGVNPGDTTEKFRLFYYEAPIAITSDTIQHQMPGSADIEFLMPATIKLIEGIDHGNIIEAYEYIAKMIKPRFQLTLDRGDQGVSAFCRKRKF